MARDIAVASPDLILRGPPTAERIPATQIFRVDHAPMIEGPFVVAPAAFAVLGRSKVTTGLADTLQSERWRCRRAAGVVGRVDFVVLDRGCRTRGEERLVSEFIRDRLFYTRLARFRTSRGLSRLDSRPGSRRAVRSGLSGRFDFRQGRRNSEVVVEASYRRDRPGLAGRCFRPFVFDPLYDRSSRFGHIRLQVESGTLWQFRDVRRASSQGSARCIDSS